MRTDVCSLEAERNNSNLALVSHFISLKYQWGTLFMVLHCCLFSLYVSHCCLKGCFKVEGHAGRTGRKVCMWWLIAPLTENTFSYSTHFTHCSHYCVNSISLNNTSCHCLTQILKKNYIIISQGILCNEVNVVATWWHIAMQYIILID